jgi:nitrogen fixation/metabolism regulation signal transduction histidine kinase
MAPPAISPTGNWIGTLLFVLLALVAIILFAIRAGELIALLVKARRENRTDHIEDRIGKFFLVVLGQSGVLRDPIPGIAHFFTFWGFIVVL